MGNQETLKEEEKNCVSVSASAAIKGSTKQHRKQFLKLPSSSPFLFAPLALISRIFGETNFTNKMGGRGGRPGQVGR